MRIPCAMCGKLLRNERALNKHTNRCKMNRIPKGSTGTGKTMTLVEIRETYPEQQYIGRPYNFNAIHTGNRHLRSGLPIPRLNPNMRCAI